MVAPMFAVTEFNGYAVEFSPFEEGRLAVATAQHFGIVGQGRQYVYQVHPDGLEPIFMFDTRGMRSGVVTGVVCAGCAGFVQDGTGDGTRAGNTSDQSGDPYSHLAQMADGIYDCAWSEANENHLISACADGSLKLWYCPSRLHLVRNPSRSLILARTHTHQIHIHTGSHMHTRRSHTYVCNAIGTWGRHSIRWRRLRSTCTRSTRWTGAGRQRTSL